MSDAFTLLATEDCSTKRITVTAGKASTPAAYLTGLKCTYPVSSERYFSQGHTQERKFLGSPYAGFVVMLQGVHDITKKDIFVWNSEDYSIEHVEQRPFGQSSETRMLLVVWRDAK